MRQGRIRVASGLTVNCSYELSAEGHGQVTVFAALLDSIGEDAPATLIARDGTEQAIRIGTRLGPDQAAFRRDEQPSAPPQ